MTAKMIQHYIVATFLMLLLGIHSSGLAQETEKKPKEQQITSWLSLGPFPTPLPAFHEDKKKDFTTEDLMRFEEFDISKLNPKLGSSIKWHDGTPARWEAVQGGEKGI